MNVSCSSRRGILAALLLASCLGLLVPAKVQAQSRAVRVFLVTLEPLGDGVPSVVVSQINQDLVDRLDSVRNLNLVYHAQTATASEGEGEARGARHNAAIQQAEQHYQAGVGLYVVEDYAGAVEALGEMQSLFEQNAADVRNWDMMVDGLARLSECQFKLGEIDTARETLYRTLTLRPDYEVNPERSGIAFSDLYSEVHDDVLDETAGTLTVTTDLEGASISVDGNEVGLAPVTVSDLRPGEHFVVAQGPSGELADERVVLDARRDTEVELTLSAVEAEAEAEAEDGEPRYLRRLRAEIRDDHVDDTLRPYLQELATRQGVDFVVLGAVLLTDDGYLAQPFIYQAEDGRFGVIDGVVFDLEMSAVAVNVYTLSQNISAAVRQFPDDLVTGGPLLAAPVVAVATPGPGPEFAMPEETTFTVPAPAVVAPAAAVTAGAAASPSGSGAPAAETTNVEAAEVAPAAAEAPVVAGVAIAGPVPPDAPVESAGISDPVPPDMQAPPPGYGYYPPPGYGYPPSGYGYPPPAEGEAGATPPAGYGYYPPPGYGYPPPVTDEVPEGQQTPAPYYPPAQGYGAPPMGYSYPPPEGYGYPAYGYAHPGYPPPEGEEGSAQPTGYGYYPPPGYGYPPSEEASGTGERPATDTETQVAMSDDTVSDDVTDDIIRDHDEDRPIYKEWWFWTATGGAIVLVAVTTAVVAGGNDAAPSGFQTEVRW